MFFVRYYFTAAASAFALSPAAHSQNLLNDVVTPSTTRIDVIRYATLPSHTNLERNNTRQIISLTSRPGDDALYTTSQDGRIHRVAPTANGLGSVSEWFNLNSAFSGVSINNGNAFHGGARSTAFHPDFDNPASNGYGKFYASFIADNVSNANFLGNSSGNYQSAVGEWTYDFKTNQVQGGSYRELFRVKNPNFDHPIKQISFNPHANISDDDYGLLYIAHGDGSVFNTRIGTGQNTQDALGKILRINPINPGGTKNYTTPGNVFSEDSNSQTLPEIYSFGHRNPHTLTFAQDSQGETHLITTEIGQDNVDEVNIVLNGRNYGWNERTGTFTFDGSIGYTEGVGHLPHNDASENNHIYPSIQIDHDDPTSNRRIATAGGFIPGPGSHTGLQGRFIFGDFAVSSSGSIPESSGGDLWSVSLDDLLAQNTFLSGSPGDDSPSDLSWIDDFDQHAIGFDRDNDGIVDQIVSDFVELLQADGVNTNRADFRFGTGPRGELFLSSKQNGAIYKLTNAVVPEPTQSLLLIIASIAFANQRKRLVTAS